MENNKGAGIVGGIVAFLVLSLALLSVYVEFIEPVIASKKMREEFMRNRIKFCNEHRYKMNKATWDTFCKDIMGER